MEQQITNQQPLQVADDTALLDLMLKDRETIPEIYKPSNYWQVYEQIILPELRKLGLKDFRRRRNSFISSFGAVDVKPLALNLHKIKLLNNRYTKRIGPYKSLLASFNNWLNNRLPKLNPYNVGIEDLKRLLYLSADAAGRDAGAKLPKEFSISLYGNPEDIIEIDGNVYTRASIKYYLRYVYCSKFIDFEKVNVIAEIGTGVGNQVEVLKKLYPHLTFLLFDIPPQLYVAEQYLKSVFPNDVVSFRDTRNFETMPRIEEGKIYIFGNWKFPLIDNTKIDLFWNAASFQEMEPHIVENYLKYVNKNAKNVFLKERMEGKSEAKRKGQPGVMKKTTLDDYKSYLSGLEVVDVSSSRNPIGHLESNSSFWNVDGSAVFWKKQESSVDED